MRHSLSVAVSASLFFYFFFTLQLCDVCYQDVVKSGEKRIVDNVLGARTASMQMHLAGSIFTAGVWFWDYIDEAETMRLYHTVDDFRYQIRFNLKK